MLEEKMWFPAWSQHPSNRNMSWLQVFQVHSCRPDSLGASVDSPRGPCGPSQMSSPLSTPLPILSFLASLSLVPPGILGSVWNPFLLPVLTHPERSSLLQQVKIHSSPLGPAPVPLLQEVFLDWRWHGVSPSPRTPPHFACLALQLPLTGSSWNVHFSLLFKLKASYAFLQLHPETSGQMPKGFGERVNWREELKRMTWHCQVLASLPDVKEPVRNWLYWLQRVFVSRLHYWPLPLYLMFLYPHPIWRWSAKIKFPLLTFFTLSKRAWMEGISCPTRLRDRLIQILPPDKWLSFGSAFCNTQNQLLNNSPPLSLIPQIIFP